MSEMPKTKTLVEEQEKTKPAPTADDKQLKPDKKDGPMPVAQAAHLLAPSEREAGAAPQARKAAIMQRRIGNARLARLLGAKPPLAAQAEKEEAEREQESLVPSEAEDKIPDHSKPAPRH